MGQGRGTDVQKKRGEGGPPVSPPLPRRADKLMRGRGFFGRARNAQSSSSTCLTVFVPSTKITFTNVPGTEIPAALVVAGVTASKKAVRESGWPLTSCHWGVSVGLLTSRANPSKVMLVRADSTSTGAWMK